VTRERAAALVFEEGSRRRRRTIAGMRAMLLAVLAGSCAAAATVTAAPGDSAPTTYPTGAPAQQTHPVVRPHHPTRRSHVAVRFTLAEAPGRRGAFESDYRVQVDRPARSRAACAAAAAPRPVTSGAQGSRVTVALPAPSRGWCRGRYVVTVFLQRGPYCPKPQGGQPPQACPEFATQDLRVGRTTFVVGAPRR